MVAMVAEMSMDVLPLMMPPALGNDTLSQIKNCHRNRKGVTDQIDRNGSFEYIFKEHERVDVVHIVLFSNHGDQLIAKNKRYDNARYRDYYVFR